MQTIDLADTLTFERSDEVTLRCPGMDVAPDNLILRAAHLLRERAAVKSGAAISCAKRIPVSAGLAGGSADAAATLVGLCRLWSVDLDPVTLQGIAEQLGADVPFCLVGGTAFATGTGRDVERLPAAPPHWVVLVPIGAGDPQKTAHMYARLGEQHRSDGSSARLLAGAIGRGSFDYSATGSAFTDLAVAVWPEAGRALELLEASGSRAASLSGAGPSVYGLFGERGQAEEGARRLRVQGVASQVHRFVESGGLQT